jgi:hypothetical protein
MKFTFIKPKYLQSKTDFEIELFRLKLIKDYVNELNEIIKNEKIKQLKGPVTPRQKRKTGIYISQLIMNVNTNNSYNKKTITVKDNLFIRPPTIKETKDFYRDLNYTYGVEKVFKYDEFGLYHKIKEFIKLTTEFHDSLNTTPEIANKKFKTSKTKTHIKFILNKELIREYKKYLDNELLLDIRIYNKLRNEYTGPKNKMDMYILCAIIRYNTLGSEANQFVHDLKYKEMMREAVGSNFECFASMFNHYYKHYCSMFYDIEQYFGSCGSFFGLTMLEGVYHVNPPYDENLLEKMGNHIFANIKPGVIINAALPDWEDFYVEDQFDKQALAKFIIYDKFMNPYTFKYVHIPPYIMYVFAKVDKNDININYKFNILKNNSNSIAELEVSKSKSKKNTKKSIRQLSNKTKKSKFNKKSKVYSETVEKVNKMIKLTHNYYTGKMLLE